MGVSWELASTTTLVVLEEATQVCEGPQSCEGGHPPQVCPHPSSPHVLLVQLEAHATPPDPPEAGVPPDPLDVPPVPPAPPPVPPAAPPVPLVAPPVPEPP